MKTKLVLLALIVGVLGGCATPARIDHMSISSKDATKYHGDSPLKNSISIKSVSGGESTNPMWTSEIGNKEFQQALVNSLKAAKLLSSNKEGQYFLDVKMISVDQPFIGASLTVTTTIEYTLVRFSDYKKVFNQKITESYTAQFSDSFLAYERLKLANEGSAKKNITVLIDKLYELKINPQEISITQ